MTTLTIGAANFRAGTTPPTGLLGSRRRINTTQTQVVGAMTTTNTTTTTGGGSRSVTAGARRQSRLPLILLSMVGILGTTKRRICGRMNLKILSTQPGIGHHQ